MIKKIIKSNEYLYKIYQRIRYPKESAIRYYFEKVNNLIKTNKYNCFVFDGNNIWLRVFENIEYLYVPNKFGGLLGLETKEGFELTELEFVEKNIKNGDVFLDIGANFGLYSIFIGKKFESCQIHSFEPVPETFEILRQNIEHNKLNSKIKINNIGLADKTGQLFFSNDKYAGNHIIWNPQKNDMVVKVNVQKLDDYIKDSAIQSVNFIKCDVEGAELLVLKGAEDIISKFHPIILIEIYNEWTQRFGYNAIDVINFLLEFGYQIKAINPHSKKIEEFDPSKLNSVYDFIFYYDQSLVY